MTPALRSWLESSNYSSVVITRLDSQVVVLACSMGVDQVRAEGPIDQLDRVLGEADRAVADYAIKGAA